MRLVRRHSSQHFEFESGGADGRTDTISYRDAWSHRKTTLAPNVNVTMAATLAATEGETEPAFVAPPVVKMEK